MKTYSDKIISPPCPHNDSKERSFDAMYDSNNSFRPQKMMHSSSEEKIETDLFCKPLSKSIIDEKSHCDKEPQEPDRRVDSDTPSHCPHNASEEQRFDAIYNSNPFDESQDIDHLSWSMEKRTEIDLFYEAFSKFMDETTDSIHEDSISDVHDNDTSKSLIDQLQRDTTLLKKEAEIQTQNHVTNSSDKHIKKSVKFRNQKEIKLIPHLKELTEYKSSLWYNQSEFNAMEIDRENAVALIRSGITDFDDEINFTCMRGLEHLVTEEQEVQRHENIGFVVFKVLEEQQKQCEANVYFDEQAIAQVSLRYTKWSKDMALVIAKIDESYASMQRDFMNSEQYLNSYFCKGLLEQTSNPRKSKESVQFAKKELRQVAGPRVEVKPERHGYLGIPFSDKKKITSEIVFTFR